MKDGIIWLGISNVGVCKLKIDFRGEMFLEIGYEKKVNIKNNLVCFLLVFFDGNVYVGYMDGFVIFLFKKDVICEYYIIRNGLCSNFIGCLVEDN